MTLNLFDKKEKKGEPEVFAKGKQPKDFKPKGKKANIVKKLASRNYKA